MSKAKTIEILSKHIGKLSMTFRNDEKCTVVFEDRGGVGYALCDEDEAAHLLGEIGKPDFWKPGQDEAPVEIKTGENLDTGKTEITELTRENYADVKDANMLKKLLKTCSNKALLMELVATETQAETPKATWANALNARLAELAE